MLSAASYGSRPNRGKCARGAEGLLRWRSPQLSWSEIDRPCRRSGSYSGTVQEVQS